MSLKILDYGNPKPFRNTIGKPRQLAWPVNAFRVTLPKPSAHGSGGGLNPFEHVVLKVLDAGGIGDAREAKAIAAATCIPHDLVQDVLLRLQDKGFIDEYHEIVAESRDRWERKADEERKPSAFVTALVFRELASGKILPFVHILDDQHPLKKNEEEEFKFKQIWEGKANKANKANRNTPPTPKEIISALRQMKKRSELFGDGKHLPPVKQITITEKPELYYLNCPIAIQKSDGEFRIADPFGNGFSLPLETSFRELLETDVKLSDWFIEWKNNLHTPRQSKKEDNRPKEPFENDVCQARYPQLVANLRIGRSVEKIYASLEWALFYHCNAASVNTVVSRLRLLNVTQQQQEFKTAAAALGLDIPKYDLASVPEGKLIDFLSGKAEMTTVLAIAILQSQEALKRVAVKFPNFLSRLKEIKCARDETQHGKRKKRENDELLPVEAIMREVIHILLPEITFSDTPKNAEDKDAAADARLDARTSIQGEFGFRLFNKMDENLQERLIAAERFFLSCKDGDDAQSFVSDLYAATQTAFRPHLTGARLPLLRESELIDSAAEKAAVAGLGELQETLRTVGRKKLKKTLQGNDQTLGACVVAFLLISDEETLQSIADAQPAFLADIAELIVKRGHGNTALPLAKDKITTLRSHTYTTIKTLLEK
jgi:hypothetical protein